MKGQPLKSTRQRFQSGSLRKVARKTGFVWEYRYRDNSQPGCPLRQCTLSTTLYPTESKALAALQPMLVKINGEESFVKKQQATFSTLIDLYIVSERLHEVKATRPGDVSVADGLQYSTACSYLTSLNRYIKPRWGDTLVHELKPAAVDAWLKSLTKVRKPGQTGCPRALVSKDKGQHQGHDVQAAGKGYVLGAGATRTEPSRVGGDPRRQQAAEEAVHSHDRAIP
jgi:hypothetical protein